MYAVVVVVPLCRGLTGSHEAVAAAASGIARVAQAKQKLPPPPSRAHHAQLKR
jgi:hypothetical protein